MNARLHRKTPSVNAIDTLRLPFRHFAYHPRHLDQPAPPRTTQRDHAPSGPHVPQPAPRAPHRLRAAASGELSP
ncbi:hypothetical protein B1218_35175, partial [Pseudomonas ogarae]